MASVSVNRNFIEQVKESRSKIRDCFKRSHEALQLRENILLSRIDQIEKDYNNKNQEVDKLLETLNKEITHTAGTFSANTLTDVHQIIQSAINKKITELTADTDSSIEFEWNNQFETDIEQLGSIKLNSQIIISPTRTYPPQVKPVVPDYKAKQLPTTYCCKKSTDKKAPGELNCPENKRVQILTQELKFHSMLGIGLFNHPRDVKVTRDRVLVLDGSDPCMFVFNSDHVLTNRLITRGVGKQTNKQSITFRHRQSYNLIMGDYSNHCVYVFNQEGEQIHKFGKKGQGIGEFDGPFGIAIDNTGHIIVVCEKNTNCLQFF
ncbi:Tripartite motif-containing protein 2 isoform X3 [Oopsacas minuta]|uniref:Tripartite motif-containing protein 2 isoform X3 n=1 Tax=Oopsacas minuta TaxID=111878 RepID=A0AAV7JLI7_9METZ|nr:Tripartite motif-containing protein 2 isoform X3 [Oopsacas minuta]